MKNILKYLLLLMPILLLWSCGDDIEEVIATPSTAPIILESGSDAVNLDPNYRNNPAITLTWSHADYDVQAVNNYTILFALSESFEEATEIIETTNRTQTWTVNQLNTAVQSIGMAPNEVGTLFVKVVSTLGSQGQLPMESNVVQFQMTPYVTYSFNDYYLVGNATSAGWDTNNNNQALFRDPSDENLYSFTGYFANGDSNDQNEGRFKLIEILGSWQPQWGDARNEGEDSYATSGEIAGNPGTQDSDPGRFGVPAAGYYEFSVNFSSMTYAITPVDASNAPIYDRIGIIGDAIDTGSDEDIAMMRNESFDPHNWYLQNVELANGEIKFRANNAWDVSWGNTTLYSGVGVLGGPDIPVTSGTYNIYFNDLTGEYQLIPVEE
ncbi:SusF/SusE family outer membrane protein [Flavobacteriaceae bacterium Ap0902]|nr:SusF/SusE family outer membrane protein [Flavobacteriaceae bacterium Ap0902]